MQNVRTRNFEAQLDSGEAGCIELVVPYQGRLNRLHVSQLDGDLEGFSAVVYDRADACAGVAEDSANPDDPYATDYAKSHRVVGPLDVDSGDNEALVEEKWVFYENRDELPDNGIRNNKLYLEVTPAGSGAKRFLVTITTVRDN